MLTLALSESPPSPYSSLHFLSLSLSSLFSLCRTLQAFGAKWSTYVCAMEDAYGVNGGALCVPDDAWNLPFGDPNEGERGAASAMATPQLIATIGAAAALGIILNN